MLRIFVAISVTGYSLGSPRALLHCPLPCHTGLAGAWEKWNRVIEGYFAYQQQASSYLCVKMVILHVNSRLAREMSVTLTHDVNLEAVPLVTMPAQELGDGLLYTTGP